MSLFMSVMQVVRRLRRGGHAPNPMVYALPKATVFRKYYNRHQFFDEIDWSNWNEVVDGFEDRFDKWYFTQMRAGHGAYVDLCALCALVDVFSLHQSRRSWHEPKTYKEFLRRLDPVFRTKLQQPIEIGRLDRNGWQPAKLRDFADVFYTGVRCSLHHHGDLLAFAGMSGTGHMARELRDAGASMCGTKTYSIVVFDPAILSQRLRLWLGSFCNELRRDPKSQMALAFKTRLEADFGVNIP